MKNEPVRARLVRIEALSYFTLEVARPSDSLGRISDLTAQARQASEQMRRDGVPVRFVRSVFVPEDEVCLYVFGVLGGGRDRGRALRRASVRAVGPTVTESDRGNDDEHSR